MQLYKYLMDQIQTSDVKRVLVRQFIPIMQDDAIDIWRWKMFGMSAEYSTLHYSSLYNLLIIWNIEWIKWSLCETPLALTLPKYYHQSCPKEVSIEKLLKGAWLTHFFLTFSQPYKGGLISEHFSLWLQCPKKCAKSLFFFVVVEPFVYTYSHFCF